MVYEYAVAPAAINNWQDFRFIYDQVGVEHGRLISRFPGKWAGMVIEAVKANPHVRDIERSSIVTKLQNLERNKMARLNRPYDPEMNRDPEINWMINVKNQQKRNPFHAVIARQNEIDIENFLNMDNLDASHPLWNVPKGQVVPRRAWNLACCARLLLQISRDIIIVDPHFDPDKSRFLETFSHMVTFAFEQHVPNRLELHVEDKGQDDDWWHEICLKYLPDCLPVDFPVAVYRWQKKPDGDKPHARYVLTELGGICYDYGLDEWEGDGQTTDVSLLSHSVYEQRWSDYQEKTAAYTLIDNFPVHGGRENPG
ncbi:hypothetical protein KKB28_00590 [bacterium]|nr:hypothetical protein [bacterium]